MQPEQISASVSGTKLAAQLRALVPAGASVSEPVKQIIDEVGADGDSAVRRYTELHDTQGPFSLPARIAAEDLALALSQLRPEIREGIELAARNVLRVAAASLRGTHTVDFGTHSVSLREVAVKSAAVYVPGGRAPYPSTVVMGVTTARAAGVARVAVCTPPGPDGLVHPAILAACELAGADEVYRIGGAQAIAAMALGTETITPVEVVVGPGNLYVQEAKRQLSAQVGIDSFAGPSDLLVIAAEGTDSDAAALDLLAQAEHGPGTLVVAASPHREILDQLHERIDGQLPESAAVCRLVRVPSLEYAVELAEAFAPEHLELLGPQAEQLAPRITRAGCVFVGTGTAFGDYVAGSNHTLPTGGAARFASALNTQHFRRLVTEVVIREPDHLAQAAAPLARAEGFELHAQSMEARIGEN